MNLVFGHDATVNDWLARKFGAFVIQQPSVSVGVVDRDGVLRGAFVVTHKTDTTAELHVYGRTSNDTWRALFRWVFATVHRLEVRTAKSNKATKKAAPKFGAKFEGVERDYYGPGCDALRFYMTPASCRWLRSEGYDGQSIQGA